jgi:energy-coupling factor transport system permease protein
MINSGTSRFTALQYRPDDSPLHRLDARTKILASALAIAAVLAAPHPLGYLAIVVLVGIAAVFGHIGPQLLWRAFGPVIVLFVVGGLLTAAFIPGPILYRLGPLHVTRPGMDLVVRAGVQTLVILSTTALTTISTAPSALGNGLLWYMHPLRRLRVPVDEIAVMVSLGLAFLPLLQRELQRILLAQRARGADFRRGSFETRARNAIALLPPLLASNLRRAEELAVAMEAREYVPGALRSVLNAGHFGRNDIIAVIVTLIFAVLTVRI